MLQLTLHSLTCLLSGIWTEILKTYFNVGNLSDVFTWFPALYLWWESDCVCCSVKNSSVVHTDGFSTVGSIWSRRDKDKLCSWNSLDQACQSRSPQRRWTRLCAGIPAVTQRGHGVFGETTFSIRARRSLGPRHREAKWTDSTPTTSLDGGNGNKRLYARECYHFVPLL